MLKNNVILRVSYKQLHQIIASDVLFTCIEGEIDNCNQS